MEKQESEGAGKPLAELWSGKQVTLRTKQGSGASKALISMCLEGSWCEAFAQPEISKHVSRQAWRCCGGAMPSVPCQAPEIPHPGCLPSWGCPSPPTGPQGGFAPLGMTGSGLSKADPWEHKVRYISNCHVFIFFRVFPGFSVV